MRILYHAINGVGLGHLMRLSAIAVAVRDKAPEVHQFITTSANYPPHLSRLNMPVMILPGSDAGPFIAPDRRARSVSSEFAARILDHVIDEYNPHIVVFDTHAPWRLVKKVVDQGRRATLVYRNCREEYLLKNLRDGFLARFHLILIPHSASEFQAGVRRRVTTQLENLETVRYVGPVVYPGLASAAAIKEISRVYSLAPSDDVVVVTAGGGGLGRLNGKLFQNACRAAVELRKRRPALRMICVGGPYAGRCKVPEGCTYVESEPRLQALMARADVVIAVPGYNTVQEILQSGARAALIPVMRKTEDLHARVEALVRRGRARRLELDASPQEYMQCMEDLLSIARPAPETFNGAAEAAKQILQMAVAPRRYVCSREPLSRSLATSFRSARALARELMYDKECPAIIRIDWDRAEKLFAALGPGGQGSIVGLEIVLGRSSVKEAARRLRTVHSFLQSTVFPQEDLIFSVDDPSGGRLLAELTLQVRDLRFKALVARFTERALRHNAAGIFENLELCRDVVPQFKIDITLLDNNFAFVDQP